MGNPYVKIADPNIIDLASWQNLINTVNQHADSIAKLTSSFGLTWSPTTLADGSWKTVFDAGNQIIQYGRTKMEAAGTGGTANSVFGNTFSIQSVQSIVQVDRVIYEETISYPTSFSSAPTVIATASRQNSTSSTVSDYNVTISDITISSFKARVVNKDQSEIPADKTWYINWIALGPY